MRKLAHIEKIHKLEPIENSDNLELASVLGWKVVVRKNEFKVGDLVIYVEIDSLLPEKEEFEFLRPKKFRIKTQKIRGVLSQGICFPLSIIPDIDSFEIEQDVTNLLGIKKWEPVLHKFVFGDTLGRFPDYLIKSDETRIQSVPRLLEEIKGIEFYSTVKCDGTSCTISSYNGEDRVCSRNLAKKPGKNIFWNIEKKYNVLEKLRSIGNFAVQGEICGPDVQKNRLCLKEIDFFVFNVFDIDNCKFLDFKDYIEFSQSLGLKTVPVENESFLFDFELDDLLEMVKGKYPNTKNNREGLVFRPTQEKFSKVLNGRMSFKVINNEYLLKGGD